MDNLLAIGEKKRIVVIGGGFAGINFVKGLFNNKAYEIIVVDKNNYNYFTPFLYQVATSFLDPSSISYPFRKLFRRRNITFRMAELINVDSQRRLLQLSDGDLAYDYLVFAAGTKANFFGIESVQRNAVPLKDVDDALYMRNQLIKSFEQAVRENDPATNKKLMTTVIAGGGATGVEVAGMLAEMKKNILYRDYPELKGVDWQIYLVDGLSVLIAPMSEKTHKEAFNLLTALGVKIILNTRVVSYENDEVRFADNSVIPSKMLIWAAGVTANIFSGIPPSCTGPGHRMITDQYNKVIGLENTWAIGDISIQFSDPVYPKGHPQLAQPAIQQGERLAKNFLYLSRQKPLKPFLYFDRGDMAIIGRTHAVADLFKQKLHLKGFLALFSWLFIHVVSLVNYNNKIKTLFSWATAYLTKDQALRMIFRSCDKK